jgi:hypothetical protein
MKSVGLAEVNVKYQNQCKNIELFIVKKGEGTPFGQNWLK